MVGLVLTACACSLACNGMRAERLVVRVGHFPNITHAQGLIGHYLTRQEKGWFERALGTNVTVHWYVFNGGPSSMEGILAGSIDLAYVGANPAVNAHLRSGGKDVRVIAGACSGGAALVVQPDGRIQSDADFKGKRVATPQLGNTQDVAARVYFRSLGFKVTLTGGDVHVLPISNPDQLTLFKRGDLDAVWTVEPWISRLMLEADGKLFLNEGELWPETKQRYVTTHLVASTRFLKQHPKVASGWVAAHVDLTLWIQKHPEEAREMINAELKAETTRSLPDETIREAFERLEFTWDPVSVSLMKAAEHAHQLRFLRGEPNLKQIYALEMLNAALRQRSLPEVK